jgi:hypothetical protein
MEEGLTMKKTPRQFIDAWGDDYNWEEGLRSGEVSPEGMLQQLRTLQADYESQGCCEPEDMPDYTDWDSVRDLLESCVSK